MDELTIFHKIRDGEVPAEIVYEDDEVLVFKDINPKAPLHLLFIAKKDDDFVPSIADLDATTQHVPGMLIQKAQEFAKEQGIDGYKLMFHVGEGWRAGGILSAPALYEYAGAYIVRSIS